MSEPTHNDDHWRRLAAELGLDVGPAPEQPAEPSAPAPPRPPDPPAQAEPPPYVHRPEPIAEFDEGLEPPPPRGRRGRPVAAPVENVGLFEDDSAEAEVEGSDVEAAAVPEVRPDEAEEASEELSEEQGGKRRRRRRPRRKKKPGEPVAEGAVPTSDDAPAEELPAATDDDDEEEPTAEVVRNWNVPSWDELIGSLHRPER